MSNVYILPTLPIEERIARQRRRFISARFVIQRGLNQGQPIKAISGVLCCARRREHDRGKGGAVLGTLSQS